MLVGRSFTDVLGDQVTDAGLTLVKLCASEFFFVSAQVAEFLGMFAEDIAGTEQGGSAPQASRRAEVTKLNIFAASGLGFERAGVGGCCGVYLAPRRLRSKKDADGAENECYFAVRHAR